MPQESSWRVMVLHQTLQSIPTVGPLPVLERFRGADFDLIVGWLGLRDVLLAREAVELLLAALGRGPADDGDAAQVREDELAGSLGRNLALDDLEDLVENRIDLLLGDLGLRGEMG